MKRQKTIEDKLWIEGVGAKGFGIIPKYAMRDPDLGSWSKLVYAYLCCLSGSGNQTWPRRETILKDLSIGKATYYSAQKELIYQGYITVHQSRNGNRQGTNIYTLVSCPEKVRQQYKNQRKSKAVNVNRVISSGLKAGGYGMLPRLVMQDERLWAKAKLVYAYLASYAGAGCVAFPTNKIVITELQLNRKAWQRSLRELSEYGYLNVIQRRAENGRYDICDYYLLDTPEKARTSTNGRVDYSPKATFRGTEKSTPGITFEDTEESAPEVIFGDTEESTPEVTFEDTEESAPEVTFGDTEESVPEVTFKDTGNSPEVTLREAQNQDAESANTYFNNLVTVLSSNNINQSIGQDRVIDYEGTKKRLEGQLEMDHAEQIYGRDADTAKELLALLVDVLSSPGDTFQLGNRLKPKAPLWKLTPDHLLYVIESVREQQQQRRIYNLRAYRLAALYHAPETIGNYRRSVADERQYLLETKRLLESMKKDDAI